MLPVMSRILPGVLLVVLVTGPLARGGERKTDGPPLLIRVDGKFGYIDRAGKVIVPPQFSYALNFVEGMARVDLGEKWTYVNEAGELMKKKFDKPARFMDDYDFSDGLAVHRVGGKEKRTPDGYHTVIVGAKYGYINKKGEVVIPVSFEGAGGFRAGLAAVKKEEKWGFIDKRGELAIPARYEAATDFAGGLARVKVQGKWGYIDKKGALMGQAKFDSADEHKGGLARVMVAGKFGFVNLRGELVIEPQFEYAGHFSDGRCLTRVDRKEGEKIDMKFGYIDKTGKFVIPAKYGDAADFSEGLAAVKINSPFTDKKGPDNTWGYIDKTGAYVITPRFYQAGYFSEGLAKASPKTLAPYGYIDRTGKFVIEPQFNLFTGPFQRGIARVYTDRDFKTRDDHGYIDCTGKFLWPLRALQPKKSPPSK
jgi:hypothetical protein